MLRLDTRNVSLIFASLNCFPLLFFRMIFLSVSKNKDEHISPTFSLNIPAHEHFFEPTFDAFRNYDAGKYQINKTIRVVGKLSNRRQFN